MRQQYSVDKYDDPTSVASPAFEMDALDCSLLFLPKLFLSTTRDFFCSLYSLFYYFPNFLIFFLFLFEYLIIIPLYPILLFFIIIIFLAFVLADQGPSGPAPFTATINASSIPACLLHSPRGPCCFAVSV